MARRITTLALAFAALVACAAARPEYITTPAKNTNAANTKGAVKQVVAQTTPSDAENAVPVAENAVLDAENAVPKAESAVPKAENAVPDAENAVPKAESATPDAPAPKPEQKLLFQDTTKAVHQRFPHAVLFGGTCGGSIISPKWILTAGHCTLFTGGRYVLAGTNNSDDGSGVSRRVKNLYIHPLFSVGPYWVDAQQFNIKQVAARWDFLLAELEDPLELDGVTIAAVPLDDQTTTTPDTLVGYAGYGTDHHGGFMRSEMHAMNLKIQADSTCHKLEQFNSEDMLCAKGYAPNYDSACNGDSGSGLVGNGRLIGIASWVENDAIECKNGNLVVFSKVASVRDWISKVTGI